MSRIRAIQLLCKVTVGKLNSNVFIHLFIHLISRQHLLHRRQLSMATCSQIKKKRSAYSHVYPLNIQDNVQMGFLSSQHSASFSRPFCLSLLQLPEKVELKITLRLLSQSACTSDGASFFFFNAILPSQLVSLSSSWLCTSLYLPAIICYSLLSLKLLTSCQNVVHPAAKELQLQGFGLAVPPRFMLRFS